MEGDVFPGGPRPEGRLIAERNNADVNPCFSSLFRAAVMRPEAISSALSWPQTCLPTAGNRAQCVHPPLRKDGVTKSRPLASVKAFRDDRHRRLGESVHQVQDVVLILASGAS